MKRNTMVPVFLLPFAVAMLFAFATDHRWEDWYITYRASDNLAKGNGLVFVPGERVHTFTSPIGTLLPAIIRAATLNKSDEYVIWIFRLTSSCLLGVSTVLILFVFQSLKTRPIATVFMTAMFSTSVLIIDFSINGMETAFMMFFLSYLLYVAVARPPRMTLHLAITVAGLMYTRPDGMIYGGSILFSLIVFNDRKNTGLKRGGLFWLYCRSCALGALLYSPWLVATTAYYGTPVPHTVIAKGALHNFSATYIFAKMLLFPVRFLCFSQPALFTPPYSDSFGGWAIDFHAIGGRFRFDFLVVGRVLTTVAGFVCFLPRIKVGGTVRALSLAVLLQIFYLMNISGQGAMPWYLPNVLLPTLVVLSLCLDYLAGRGWQSGSGAGLLKFIACLVVFFNCSVLLLGGIQLKTQQEVIETGNRKEIGVWLKAHASGTDDTVFLECLGYIPFFSGLKPYDFPGMSSPEVVAIRKKLNTNEFAVIINALQPDWLVLRPREISRIMEVMPGLLEHGYESVRTFDVSANIPESRFLFGRGYLIYDSRFVVFRKKSTRKTGMCKRMLTDDLKQ